MRYVACSLVTDILTHTHTHTHTHRTTTITLAHALRVNEICSIVTINLALCLSSQRGT